MHFLDEGGVPCEIVLECLCFRRLEYPDGLLGLVHDKPEHMTARDIVLFDPSVRGTLQPADELPC